VSIGPYPSISSDSIVLMVCGSAVAVIFFNFSVVGSMTREIRHAPFEYRFHTFLEIFCLS